MSAFLSDREIVFLCLFVPFALIAIVGCWITRDGEGGER